VPRRLVHQKYIRQLHHFVDAPNGRGGKNEAVRPARWAESGSLVVRGKAMGDMKNSRFDGMMRSLHTARSRREALAALLGGLSGLFLTAGPDVTSAKRKKARRNGRRRKNRRPANGPCDNGDKEGKDCRCRKLGDACTTDASCCPRTKGMSCREGTCQPCDVCLSGCDFDSVQVAIDGSAPGDTIHICAGVFEERLIIAKDLTLIGVGDGANGTTLDGSRGGSTVTVIDGTVTLERLRITGGDSAASGGGIFKQKGSLTLTSCTVSGNAADGNGGGIATQSGTLTLNDSTVTGNEAQSGGGIHHGGGATTLNTSSVSGNEAVDRGGGIFAAGGAMTLHDCRVEENTAGIEGGGIFREVGAFSPNDSTVTGNSPDNCVGVVCMNA
jgi:hypothetical protein